MWPLIKKKKKKLKRGTVSSRAWLDLSLHRLASRHVSPIMRNLQLLGSSVNKCIHDCLAGTTRTNTTFPALSPDNGTMSV